MDSLLEGYGRALSANKSRKADGFIVLVHTNYKVVFGLSCSFITLIFITVTKMLRQDTT